MDQIENIIEKYRNIISGLEQIEREIKTAKDEPDYKSAGWDFFDAMQCMVDGGRKYFGVYLRDIIEAEFRDDPDMKQIDRCVENINTTTREVESHAKT